MSNEFWKKCSSCKKPIDFETKYWICEVSTCNRARMALVFCSVACWDAHLPFGRHRRGTGALERKSPTRQKHLAEMEEAAAKAESIAARAETSAARAERSAAKADRSAAAPASPPPVLSAREVDALNSEILVVASRVGELVDQRAQLRVSKAALHALSHLVRRECDLAIDAARADGRRTVLDRDFIRPPSGTSEDEVLVVVSKTKGYIKAVAGMNTGNTCVDVLSAHIRGWLHAAIRVARQKNVGALLGTHFEGL